MTHGDVETTWRTRLCRSVRSGALDVLVVLGYLAASAVALYVLEVGGTARALLGLPLVLFLPGYALVAAAFPARRDEATAIGVSSVDGLLDGGTPGWYERLALSLAGSLAVLPLFGLALPSTRWGFEPRAVLVTLGGFTVLGMFVAVVRRSRLSRSERFRAPVDAASTDAYRGLFAPDTRFDGALNVVLILSMVVALSAVGYALVAPQSGAATTQFQLLAENESGDLVAGDYPEELPPGASDELVVSITNGADEDREYTVVVETHRVEETDGSLETLEESEMTRLETSVDAGATAQTRHTVDPSITGETLRINYYLYEGDAPDDADAESADEHLWITVDGTAGG
ncbi:DUF1616 domain-containing protein [Natronoarchaeum mannanilyticum]|uniref:DUF1616 domain-containing protein n=1 Tax=Natronoarchaeum mannanilyticum TaxID=926360 RepID=A0AAV3TC92_9EURY